MFKTTKLSLIALGLMTIAGISATTAQADEAAAPAPTAQVADQLDSAGATSVIGGFETERWTVTLRGGVHSQILVVGDGDSDLDVFLYDENGNLMDYDNDYSDTCLVSVTPIWTGSFTVEVRNLGRRANWYSLTRL